MATLPDGARVAVIDDVAKDAENTSIVLTDAGFLPVTVDLLESPDALANSLLGQFAGVVCDHRLQAKVKYYGAEVVAACVSRGLPAVLITTYADPRDNATIQAYRPQIPELLQRGLQSDGPALRKALDYAAEETAGNYRKTRRPHRTVARIVANHDNCTADILIPAWSTDHVVNLPHEAFGPLSSAIRVGQRYLADVNIHADSPLDVYATNFEQIPDVSLEELIGSQHD